MPDTATGTVTFLFTDIEESTRLWQQQPEAMRAALARHDALLRTAIEENGGHVFKTMGDAFCADFSSPRDAAGAAVGAQRALQHELPNLRVRMAVHTGEAERREGDFFGPVLNHVARLLAAGHGGQILLSQATANRVRACLPGGTRLQLLGIHRLRDIETTETIFQLQPPDLPADFPPLNTLDVAFRRGVVRASLIAVFMLAVVSSLALWGWKKAISETRERRHGQLVLYASDMSVAQHALETGNLGWARELLEAHRPKPGEEDLRGFEWRYLWRLCQEQSLATMRAPNGGLKAIAFTPDGATLVSVGGEGATLWDVRARRAVGTLAPPTQSVALPGCLAISPDGKLLAAALGLKITLWDTRTRRPLGRLNAATGNVTGLAFSPDSKTLVSAGDRVRLWNVAAGREKFRLPSEGWAVAVSPNGKLLAVSVGASVCLWDLQHRHVIAVLQGHTADCQALGFSPDGKLLASGGWDRIVRLWDVAHHRAIATLPGHTQGVTRLAFSTDGKLLASSSSDYSIKVWDVTAHRELVTFLGHEDGVQSVAFSPDGRLLASASDDGTVKLWNPARRRGLADVFSRPDRAVCEAFSPDGKTLATGGSRHGIWLWGVTTPHKIVAFGDPTCYVVAVAFSPDGKLLAARTWSPGRSQGTLRLWEVATRQPVASLDFPWDYWVGSLAFSPNSRLLAIPINTRLKRFSAVRLWDLTQPRRPRALATFEAQPNGGHTLSLQFSPDGHILATGGSEDPGVMARLWDLRRLTTAGQPSGPFPTEVGSLESKATVGGVESEVAVGALAFSPDGRTLAAGGDGALLRLWDVATRRPIGVLRGHKMSVAAIAFSPDGKTLATGSNDQEVKLWSVATQREMLALNGHALDVNQVAFSVDGSTLASASMDHTVRLWRTASFAETDAPARPAAH